MPCCFLEPRALSLNAFVTSRQYSLLLRGHEVLFCWMFSSFFLPSRPFELLLISGTLLALPRCRPLRDSVSPGELGARSVPAFSKGSWEVLEVLFSAPVSREHFV